MTPSDYWTECMSEAARECGATLTREQIEAIADAAMGGHECYEQAFHDPGWGDRFRQIELESEARIEKLKAEIAAHEARHGARAERGSSATGAASARILREASEFTASLIPLGR